MCSSIRTSFAALALVAGWGCGSTSDLVIGWQAEAGLVAQEAGADVEDGSHIRVCGDGATRATDAKSTAEGSVEVRDGSNAIFDAMVDDAGCSNATLCSILKSALVHRYSFDGTGTVATDSVGAAHGTVVNAELAGDGTVVLDGASSDQYVDLPNGIVRSLANATLEAWVTWNGCGGWERIFDFGDAGGGENVRGYASTTLYLTPQSMNGRDVMFGAFKRADQDALNETRAASNEPLPAGVMVHVCLVVDDANNVMTLYENGAFEGSVAYSDSLSMLNDVNSWLGRSQYVADPSFGGILHEFRIYNVALSASAIQTSFAGGPSPGFLE